MGSPAVAFTAVAVISFTFVLALVVLARRRGLLDVPNERSSHTRPTPRGGGLGLVAALCIGLALTAPELLREPYVLLALGGVTAVAVIGWLDDQRGGVSPRTRLIVHALCAAALLPLAAGAALPYIPIIVALAWWGFWTIASINVVNFMDGIDGLIGSQALIFGVHLWVNSGAVTAPAGVVLAGASVGFLLLNWSPAKIFLGDVGSGALGAFFVLAGVLAVREGALNLVTAFLPLGAIFLDATVTLIARARRGEKLSEAHRSHLYQRLANGGMGHAAVSVLYSIASGVAVALVVSGIEIGPLSLIGYLTGCALVGAMLLRRIRTNPAR
jgi:Fuc2NAc and GlcNAc transferase